MAESDLPVEKGNSTQKPQESIFASFDNNILKFHL